MKSWDSMWFLESVFPGQCCFFSQLQKIRDGCWRELRSLSNAGLERGFSAGYGRHVLNLLSVPSSLLLGDKVRYVKRPHWPGTVFTRLTSNEVSAHLLTESL